VVAIRWMKVVATSRSPPGPAQGPGVLANPALMSGSTGRREQRPSLVNATWRRHPTEINRTNGTIVDFAGALGADGRRRCG